MSANPLYCSRWKHLGARFNTKTGKSAAVLAEPTLKRAVTYTSRVCEFIFVCAFHGSFFSFTSLRLSERRIKLVWILPSGSRLAGYTAKVRHFFDISKKNHDKNQNNLFVSGQIWSEVFNALSGCRTFAVQLRQKVPAAESWPLSSAPSFARRLHCENRLRLGNWKLAFIALGLHCPCHQQIQENKHGDSGKSPRLFAQVCTEITNIINKITD